MRTGLLVDGSLRPRLRLPTGWTGPRTLASAYYSHNSYQRHYEMVTLWAATSVMHNLCPKKTTTTKKTITHATPPTHTHTHSPDSQNDDIVSYCILQIYFRHTNCFNLSSSRNLSLFLMLQPPRSVFFLPHCISPNPSSLSKSSTTEHGPFIIAVNDVGGLSLNNFFFPCVCRTSATGDFNYR